MTTYERRVKYENKFHTETTLPQGSRIKKKRIKKATKCKGEFLKMMTTKTNKYKDPNISIQERVEDLLKQMTIEEKIGQLNQQHIKEENMELSKERIRQGKVGSRILAGDSFGGADEQNEKDIETGNELQRIAIEESRLGIPIISGRDVIHGHRTVFPIPLGQAASWNDALVEEAASIAALESYSYGVHWTFAPMIDVSRDPRWGRIMEGSGEDPFLTSRMAQASTKGYQTKISACAKHFVAYGAAEGGRDYNTTECSDNTLRNVYLPPFKAAVEAGLDTVMSGFHELGGEPVSGSRYLLTDILKNEFGFDGFVISDWGSVPQLQSHGVAADRKESAYRAFDAGVDMDMATDCYLDYIQELVDEGKITMERLNDAVRRILAIKFRIGLFDHPYTDLSLSKKVLMTSEHLECSRKLAAESLVLLKNENKILPLPKTGKTIAVIGPLTELKRNLLGDWMLDGKEEHTPSILDGIKKVAPDTNILVSESLTDHAVMIARKADIVILSLGEHYANSGESSNLAELKLPVGQAELLNRIKQAGKPVVTVICAGRPLALTDICADTDGLLYAWFPGTQGGLAIAQALFGDENPSGKTPVTFPRVTGQVPIYYNHKRNPHHVDEYFGGCDRFSYQDQPGSPLFPFGYGLSYTKFEYGDVKVTLHEEDNTINTECTIKNVGAVAGTEIVQCYIQDVVSSSTRPVKELKGYKRIHLKPGESETVQFKLSEKELGCYTRNGKWVTETGEFKVWIGPDSLCTDFKTINYSTILPFT